MALGVERQMRGNAGASLMQVDEVSLFVLLCNTLWCTMPYTYMHACDYVIVMCVYLAIYMCACA